MEPLTFIQWVRQLLNGKDGLPSVRRVIAILFFFVETVLIGSQIFFMNRLANREIVIDSSKLELIKNLFEFAHCVICAMILLLLGIITLQNIIDLKTVSKTQPSNAKQDEVK